MLQHRVTALFLRYDRTRLQSMVVLLSLLLVGCSGYRVKRQTNPFQKYGVRSVGVHRVANHSSVVGITSELSQSLMRALRSYQGLDVYAGDRSEVDAHLITVVRSARKRQEALSVRTTRDASSVDARVIQTRKEFTVPASSTLTLFVTVALVRNPEIYPEEVLGSEEFRRVFLGERVIVRRDIKVSLPINYQLSGGLFPLTSESRNTELIRAAYAQAASTVESQIRSLVLDVF